MREPKTLAEKVWERHVVHRAKRERADFGDPLPDVG
jgi:hypothetical protein